MKDEQAYDILLAKIRANRLTKEVIASALAPDFTINEWLIAGGVKRLGAKATSSALVRELGVTKALISRHLSDMEEKGLIILQRGTPDSRVKRIQLTVHCEDLLERREPAVRAALKNWLAPIKREHIEVYIEVLLTVAYRLDK